MYEDETRRKAAPATGEAQASLRGLSGDDLSRIISLSDGVFAFALTLLALSLTVPSFDTVGLTRGQVSSHLAYLLQQDYNAFFGYAFAFVMIAVWWVAHHRAFRYVARYNASLVWLNMGFLLQIAVMPFVLSVFTDYASTQIAVVLFASIQVTLGITISVLWDYARHADLLQPNVSTAVRDYLSRRNWYSSGVFALSIAVSFLNVTAAEACWVLVFVVQRVLDRSRSAPLA